MFGTEKVFRVVQIRVETILNVVGYSWLKIDQQSAGNVMVIVSLVKEHILAVISLSCVFFQDTIRADSVLATKCFPKFISDLKTIRGDVDTYFGYRTVQLKE